MTFLRSLIITIAFMALAIPAQAVLPPVKNFAKAWVSIGYNSVATSVVLVSGHGVKLPATFPYPVIWWNCSDYGAPEDDLFVEIVSVTARSTDTLTVVRAQDETSAQNHNLGGKTYCMVQSITKAMWDAIRTDIAAAAGGASSITTGSGSPEGVITKTVGNLYLRTDAWSGVNVLYQKVSGTGNTGWSAQPDLATPGAIGLTSASSAAFTSLSAITTTSTNFNFVTTALTYGATVSINADSSTLQTLAATNNTSFLMVNPTNASTGRLLIVRISNTSGGVLGTITWDTLYKMATYTKPANATSRTIAFVYNGTNWIELFCGPEVPN